MQASPSRRSPTRLTSACIARSASPTLHSAFPHKSVSLNRRQFASLRPYFVSAQRRPLGPPVRDTHNWLAPGFTPGGQCLCLSRQFRPERASTASDSALIQFAIDDRGVPIKSTMRLIAGTNLEVAEAVISSAMHSQFMPAMAGTCPVNGLLEISGGWRTDG